MIGLDSNVLIRFLVQDDPKQSARAVNLIRSTLEAGDTLFLNHIALCETVWVLETAYGHESFEIADLLDQLLLTNDVSFEQKDEVRSSVMEYRTGKADFADYLTGCVNARNGCAETATFDRGLSGVVGFKLL